MSKQSPTLATPASGNDETTRFELSGRDQPDAGNFATALERNRAFAVAGGHEGPVVFPKLRPFVITCIDPPRRPRARPRAAIKRCNRRSQWRRPGHPRGDQ